MYQKWLFWGLAIFLLIQVATGQEEGSAEGEAEAEAEAETEPEAEAEEAAAAPEGELSEAAEGEDTGGEGSGGGEGAEEEECDETADGSGDGVEDLLSLGGKCKSSSLEGSGELSGSDALAAAVEQCDMDGMDEKLAGCLEDLSSRVKTLEQAVLSGEGGALEDQITLVLVKKGIIDCENDTQCDDDKACMESYKEPGRVLCEPVCERLDCPVQHSECVGTNHEASCECKEGFHGNGTDSCIPDGFTAETNGKHYKMFDEEYLEWDEALTKCSELGARLPVLDSVETIGIIKTYLETSNFTVFEQWDRSSRRIWIGLVYDRSTGLMWADGQRIVSYPASSRLFVWEARRLLSQEAGKADNSRHYGFYIDGDIAKLPGGGRRKAAVLCELLPPDTNEQQDSGREYNPFNRGGYPADGGYPNYPQRGRY